MLRPLTDDEAARVVSLSTFEIDLVSTPTGVKESRVAVVFPLEDKRRRTTMVLREEEERLVRHFDLLSRDEHGAFGVWVTNGQLMRDA